MWSDLALPWQLAFSQAWAAYCAGSYPIGAVLLDEHGKVLSTGRNHINDTAGEAGDITNNQFAHAETNTLLKASKLDKEVLHSSALFTTLEPCPMCMGVFYMSGVRQLHYAARDPYAGAADMIGSSWYLSHKPIRVFPPDDTRLETLSVGMNVENMLRDSSYDHLEGIFQKLKETQAQGMALGEQWFKERTLRKMADEQVPFSDVYDRLI